jgi:hypothetical protein
MSTRIEVRIRCAGYKILNRRLNLLSLDLIRDNVCVKIEQVLACDRELSAGDGGR